MFLSQKKPPLIGLDISSTSVKLMELSKTGSSYRIEGIGVEPLPPNAVVEKNIAEVEAVGESVKRALNKSKIKSKNVSNRSRRVLSDHEKNHHARGVSPKKKWKARSSSKRISISPTHWKRLISISRYWVLPKIIPRQSMYCWQPVEAKT